MHDQPHDNTELGLDVDVQAALDTATSVAAVSDEDTDSLAHLKQMYAGAEARTRIGLGREVQRLAARLAELSHEADMFLAEIEQLKRPLRGRLATAEAMLEHIALHRRREGNGNFFEVPGVGRWSTRTKAARFTVDPSAALAWMEDHDSELFGQFTRLPEPTPPAREVDTPGLRAHLLTQVPAASNEDDLKTANLIGEGLAASMDGVEWVPSAVAVSYSLQDRRDE